MAAIPTSTDEYFTRGGKPLLDLLEFCVMSYRMEALFAFLVREYRLQPTLPRAFALYDVFCAAEAPAKLKNWELLPPRVVDLQSEIERMREQWAASRGERIAPAANAQEPPPPPTPVAPKYLFDSLLAGLLRYPGDPIAAAGRDFDPALTPAANLPGGRMSPGQRNFVERVWQPHVRPWLVTAGFWRMATVG
jgi:hypothetical protein